MKMAISYDDPGSCTDGRVLSVGSQAETHAAQSPRTAKRNGRTRRGKLSRQQMLESAVQVLARRGYAKTGVREIASTANKLTGSLYYHFVRKEDLIASVIEHCVSTIQDQLRRDCRPELVGEDRVPEIAQALLGLSKECRAELCVLTDLAWRAPENELVRAALAKGFEDLAGEFAVLLSPGPSRERKMEAKLRTASQVVLATVQGLLVLDAYASYSSQNEAQSIQRALESMVRSLVRR
jgi:AcrR family transcriptional regulator